jgi:uncharacterized surface protein with fasciclin (FAS1) repeats
MSRTLVTRAAQALALVAIAATPVLAGGYSKGPEAGAGTDRAGNIVQVARAAGAFNTLLAAIDAAGLTGTLSGQGQGPFTVFAPTDAAFAKLPPGTVEGLLQDKARLKSILLYHVVAGEVRAADVVKLTSATTVNGRPVTIAVSGGAVKVNDASVTQTDVGARNGVIHVIDTVLIP